MSWDSLLAFNLVLMAALASPGAALLYCIKTCVSAGRIAGLATGAGLGTAAALWTLAALLGLTFLGITASLIADFGDDSDSDDEQVAAAR